MTDQAMTRTERLELAKIVRQRAKLAKDDVASREAQIRADAEAALSARFKEDDEAFKELMAEARQYVAELKAKLDARCAEIGIPAELYPFSPTSQPSTLKLIPSLVSKDKLQTGDVTSQRCLELFCFVLFFHEFILLGRSV